MSRRKVILRGGFLLLFQLEVREERRTWKWTDIEEMVALSVAVHIGQVSAKTVSREE